MECGQELPNNAKFCCRCGTPTHVNNAPNDDIRAKAEDFAVEDEEFGVYDSLNDDSSVAAKAEFIGDFDEDRKPLGYIPMGTPIVRKGTNVVYPRIKNVQTFFNGKLSITEIEQTPDASSFMIKDGKREICDLLDVTQCTNESLFIATLQNEEKLLLQWDSKMQEIICVGEEYEIIEEYNQDLFRCYKDNVDSLLAVYKGVEVYCVYKRQVGASDWIHYKEDGIIVIKNKDSLYGLIRYVEGEIKELYPCIFTAIVSTLAKDSHGEAIAVATYEGQDYYIDENRKGYYVKENWALFIIVLASLFILMPIAIKYEDVDAAAGIVLIMTITIVIIFIALSSVEKTIRIDFDQIIK